MDPMFGVFGGVKLGQMVAGYTVESFWVVGAFQLADALGDIERQERRARPHMPPQNQPNLGCRKRISRWRAIAAAAKTCKRVSKRCTTSSASKRVEYIVCPNHAHQMSKNISA
jgi:hypothetical protein